MKCRSCEHVNRPEARFCESCGERIERGVEARGEVCAVCGVVNDPETAYCEQCGQLMGMPRLESSV